MGLLDELMGGGPAQQQYGDFVNRYQQGPPHEGITDEETGQRYNEMAGQLDPNTYQQAARDSFANMPPEHREQFGQQLQGLAQQNGMNLPYQAGTTDPQQLAEMTTQVHQQNPGLLGSLLSEAAPMAMGMMGGEMMGGGMSGMGGPMGGMLGGMGGGNPIARAALGGIAAMAAQRMMGGGGFGL